LKINNGDGKDALDIIRKNVKKVKLKNKTLKNGYSEVIYEVIGIDENELLATLDSCKSIDNITLVSYGNNG